MYRQQSTTLQNSAPKRAEQNPKSSSEEATYLSWNTRKDFHKIPSLREAALETKRRCFLKIILESNVTANITKSWNCFSTVPSIVNGGDWGYIVRHLETIIVLVLLTFNCIPQRSHHTLTLPRSRIRDSSTVTLTPVDITTAIKVESSA